MATKPAVGSKVRLSIEGTVTEHVPSGLFQSEGFRFKTADGEVAFHNTAVRGTTIEVLSPPKPTFVPGKRYSPPNVTYEVARTSFGKWLVLKTPFKGLVGEVLTDEKLEASVPGILVLLRPLG